MIYYQARSILPGGSRVFAPIRPSMEVSSHDVQWMAISPRKPVVTGVSILQVPDSLPFNGLPSVWPGDELTEPGSDQ